MSAIERSRAFLYSLLTRLKHVNVYVEADDDPHDTRAKQIRATRIFIALISISIVVLVTYTMGSQRIITVEVKNISQAEYERLQAIYPNTFTCPCSQVSISLGSINSIHVTFHQVCLMKLLPSNTFCSTEIFANLKIYQFCEC